MTDKEQVIIDGVDVKDCRRRIGKDNYCRYFKRLCSNNNFNCVWKQLARKTQECEELKEKFKKFFGIDNQECWDIAFLKDENARYRKALEEIEEYIQEEEWSILDYVYKGIKDIINKAKGEGND